MQYHQKYSEKEFIGRGNYGTSLYIQVKFILFTIIKHSISLLPKRYLFKDYQKSK